MHQNPSVSFVTAFALCAAALMSPQIARASLVEGPVVAVAFAPDGSVHVAGSPEFQNTGLGYYGHPANSTLSATPISSGNFFSPGTEDLPSQLSPTGYAYLNLRPATSASWDIAAGWSAGVRFTPDQDTNFFVNWILNPFGPNSSGSKDSVSLFAGGTTLSQIEVSDIGGALVGPVSLVGFCPAYTDCGVKVSAVDGYDVISLSVGTEVRARTVSVPSTLSLFGIGLLGIAATRRQLQGRRVNTEGAKPA